MANPWDGDGFPWDGSLGPPHGRTKKPLASAFPTLKRGHRSLSALTLCHIAHGASRFLMAGLCPAGGPSMRGSAARLRPASGSRLRGPGTTGRRCPEGVFHRPPFCSNNMMRFSLWVMAVARVAARFVNRAWKTFRRPEKVGRGVRISVEKGWGAVVYNPVFRCITTGPLLRPRGVAFPPRFSRGYPRVIHPFFHMSLRILRAGGWQIGRERLPLPHERRKRYEKTDSGRALPHGCAAV